MKNAILIYYIMITIENEFLQLSRLHLICEKFIPPNPISSSHIFQTYPIFYNLSHLLYFIILYRNNNVFLGLYQHSIECVLLFLTNKFFYSYLKYYLILSCVSLRLISFTVQGNIEGLCTDQIFLQRLSENEMY